MFKGSLDYNLPFVMDNVAGKALWKGRSDEGGVASQKGQCKSSNEGKQRLPWLSIVSVRVQRMNPFIKVAAHQKSWQRDVHTSHPRSPKCNKIMKI